MQAGLLSPLAAQELEVGKTASVTEVDAGDGFSYEIEVTAVSLAGGDPLGGIRVRDELPAGMTLDTPPFGGANWNCGSQQSGADIVVTCDYTGVDLDETESTPPLSINVIAPAQGGAVVNTAVAESEADDDPFPWQSDEVEVQVVAQSDLSIGLSGPAEVGAEQGYLYTIDVSNGGPSDAPAVEVTGLVPPGARLLSVSGTGWTCRANLVVGSFDCTRPALNTGDTSEIMVNTRAPRNPPAAGVIEFDQAEVTSAADDPDPNNNSDDPVSTTVTPALALAVGKTSPTDEVTPGELVEYEISITNPGPSDAVGDLGPLLDDAFPGQLRSDPTVCENLPIQSPCWQCDWANRPRARELVANDQVLALEEVRQLVVSPDNRHVYAAGAGAGQIAVFERDDDRASNFGALSAQASANQDAVHALAVSPTGMWLAAIGASDLVLYQRDPASGALTESDSVASLNDPRDVVFGADGRSLYLAEAGAAQIRVFGLDEAAEELLEVEQVDPANLTDVAALAISPDGEFLFAAAPGDNALVSFAVAAGDGTLTEMNSIQPQADGQSVALRAVAVSADGGEIYVAGGGDGSDADALFIYTRDNTGLPDTNPQVFVHDAAAGRWLFDIRALAADPEGRWLIASAAGNGQQNAAIALFERIGEAGELDFVRSQRIPAAAPLHPPPQGEDESLFPAGLAVDRNGEHLYLAANDDDTQTPLGAVLLYDMFGAGGCGELRPGDLVSGGIADLAVPVPAGQEIRVNVHGAVANSAQAGTMTNTATLTDSGANEIDADSHPHEISLAANIQVEKTALDEFAAPVPGEPFSYRIRVTNSSGLGVNSLDLSDEFPMFGAPGVTAGFVAGTVSWTCSASGNACCNHPGGACGQASATPPVAGNIDRLLDLPGQSSVTIIATGTVHQDAAGTLENTAAATMPDGVDPLNPDSLTSTHDAPIQVRADAWIEKESLGPGEVNGEEFVAYRLLVGNNGPGTLNGLRVEDPFDDDGLDAANASWECEIIAGGGCCGYQEGGGGCPAGGGQNVPGSGALDMALALEPDARAAFEIQVPLTELAEDEVNNTARVAVPDGAQDPNSFNDIAGTFTRLAVQAEFEINKQIQLVGDAVPGEEVAFQIDVTNGGPDNAFVGVRDVFPPELEQVAWSCDATSPVPGDLSYRAHLAHNELLLNAAGTVTSADGRHVYVASRGGSGVGGTLLPSTVTAFERDHVPGDFFGTLVMLDSELDGVNDPDDPGLAVEGIAGAAGIALSHDQRHLYVAGAGADAVAVFSRGHVPGTPQFGELSFVQARGNGSTAPADDPGAGPVAGLGGARAVTVSPDDAHVYVLGEAGDSVAIFSRDEATGALGYVGRVHADELPGGLGLRAPTDLAMDADGKHLYVSAHGVPDWFESATWTDTGEPAAVGGKSYFVENSGGIATRRLKQVLDAVVPEGAAEVELAFQHRYSFDTGDQGECRDLGVLEISLDHGETWADLRTAGGSFVEGAYNGQQDAEGSGDNPLLEREGWCTRSGGFADDDFVPVTVDLSGVTVADDDTPLRLRWVLGQGSGTNTDEQGWWLDDIRLTADGETLLEDIVDRHASDSSLVVLVRDADSDSPDFGSLQHVETLQPQVDDGSDPLDGLNGAVAVAMDAAGENVYLAGRFSQAIVGFQRDPAAGTLVLAQDLRLDPGSEDFPPTALAGLTGIAVSPDGEHLVATGRDADMLTVLRRAPFSGQLRPEQVLEHGQPDSNPVAGGLAAPAGVAFSPDGQHVYTAAGGTDSDIPAVGVFSRRAPDPTFGFLETVIDGEADGYGNPVDGLLGARAVTASPDGEYVYAVGFGSPSAGVNGSLVALKRHRDLGDTSGTMGRHLEFLQVLEDGQGGVTGLDGPTGIAMAGDHLYVSSERSNAVAVFAVGSGGELSHVASYVNGSGGIEGLLGASAVAVSADQQYVYAAGRFDHSIAIFARDEESGELSFQGRVENGSGGVQGLEGVSGLAVATGGGHHLYAASRQDHAVAVFTIAADGQLSFSQVVRDGVGGEGLQGAVGVAVTREDGGSEHVLVAAPDAGSVAVFKRQTDATLSSYGQLVFVARYSNSDPGVDGLAGARAVAVNRDGSRVYVTGQNDNSLVIFERHSNPTSQTYGQLVPLELRRDGAGVAGLQGPYGVAVSPDDRHIYTASLSSHAVAAFIRRSGSSCGTRSGLGSLDEEVFVAAGGSVTLLATGRIRAGATGTLNNTAELEIPSEVDNSCGAGCESNSSDPAALVPRSVLAVDKTNNRLSAVAGSRQSYRMTVDNEGPSNAVGVSVTDSLIGNDDLVNDSAAWTCRAVGSGLLERRHSRSQSTLEIDALAGLAGVAWAADPTGQTGERVYVTGVLGDAVSSFEFDPDSGQLQYAESLVQGGSDVWGNEVSALRGARGVVTSSDGRFVYVTSQIDDAIVQFEIETEITDPNHGRLRFVAALDSQTPGMNGFNQPQGLTLSPDETWLYATSANDDALYVFARNPGNGSLSFSQRLKNGMPDPAGNTVTGLGGAAAVAASGDGAHVYVGAANENAVTVLAVDADSGELNWQQTRQSPATAGLVGAMSVALDPGGDNVYVAGRDSDSIVVFPRAQEQNHGQLGAPLQVLTPASPDLQGLRGPRQVLVGPDGEYAYAVSYDTDSIFAFRRNREDGQLEFLARYRDGSAEQGLAGASSLALNASGSYLLSGALRDAAVTSFARPTDSRCSASSGTGELDNFLVDVAAGGSVIIDLEVDIDAGAEGVTCPPPLDPDRNCVVNTVSVDIPGQDGFEVVSDADASYLTGAAGLTITKSDGLAEFRGLADARALAVTAEGDGYLYVAAPGEPGIGVYRIQPFSDPTGDYPLSFVEVVRSGEGGVSGLNGISDLVLTSDAGGAVHLYATAALDGSVVWFRRDPDSGRLQFVRRYNNNSDGIAGISGASALTLSPDQRHLYVAGRTSNSIAVFARQHDAEHEDYGSLDFQGFVQNATGGVENLVGPVDLTLDAGGDHLYAAARDSSAVVVFRRQRDDSHPDFGGLEFIQARLNGAGGVSGLLGVSKLRLDAGGGHLYAAGSGNHSLVQFSRDNDSGSGQFGQLNFAARYTQGEHGIEGLTGVSDITLADGGARLYATSPSEHAVAVFERAAGGALTWLGRIVQGETQGGAGDPVEIDGLGVARAVAEGPEGQLFITGAEPGSLAAFTPAATPVLAFDGAMLQGGGGAAPGDEVTYLITVENHGPSNVSNARVRDIFPLEFETVSWDCFAEGQGSSCVTSGSGNIDTLVDVVSGGRVVFEATGLLRPDVSGNVANTASVTLPAGTGGGEDPVHNEAVDDDTVLNHRADLAITIEDMPPMLVAGEDVSYRLRVTNTGPSEARDSRVRHLLPELFAHAQWECSAEREPGLIALVESDPGELLGYSDAAMSPDGRHVYAAGPGEGGAGSVHVLRRNILTGTLAPEQTLANGVDGVDGLAGGTHVAVSADGAHVYVAGRADDAIAVFERENDDGRLNFVQVIRDNIGAVDGLGGVSYLALSPGGAQLYAVGTLDNAVAVFDRDPVTGGLEFAQVVRNGIGDVIDLVLPRALALAPDGQHLYVAAPGSDAVVHFARAGDGQLTFVDRIFQGQQQLIDGELVTVDGLDGVRSLAFAGAGDLYAVSSEAGDHALTLLRPDEDGELVFGGLLRDGDITGVPPRPVSGLAGADAVAVTADARQLYVAGKNAAGMRTLAALRIVDGLDLQFLQMIEAGDAGDPDYPLRLLISADNRHLYSSGGEAALDVYALQRGSVCGRAGRGGVFDTVDLEAGGYVEYDISARVQANARGVVTGQAQVAAAPAVNDPRIVNNAAEFTGAVSAEAAVEVTKTLLTDEVVAGLPVNWQVTIENHGPSSVRGISVLDELPALSGQIPAPGQPGVLAGSAAWICDSQPNVASTQFIRDSGLSEVHGLAYSSDGRWLLAAAAGSHSVSLYERTQPSGWLELRDRVVDGDPILDQDGDPVGEVTGLLGASAVAVSSELKHVYVAGREAGAVAVFELDSDTGSLSFVEARHDSEPTVNGLDGPVSLLLAPDGLQLYVAARDGNAVTVFSRNPESGHLEWLQTRRDGQDNVPLNTLAAVRDVVLSPDGEYLYAAGTQSHALAVFDRDPVSGSLRFVQRVANGDMHGTPENPVMVAGLQLVRGVTLSPQGGQLYAASLADNSVTYFSRDADTGRLTFERLHVNGQNDIQGLDGATSVAVGADGERVYAAGLNSGELVVLNRDWDSGHLAYLERRPAGEDETASPQLIAVSPDGQQLAVSTNEQGGTITVMRQLPEGYCGIETLPADDLADVIDLAAGGSVTYTVDALVHPGARGELLNSAEIALPPDVNALTPGSHADSDGGGIDVVTELRIVKEVDEATLVAGLPALYSLVVNNDGPSHALAARVVDIFPGELPQADWSCQPSAQSRCMPAGTGDLDDTVDLLVDGNLVYDIEALVDPGALGQVSNTASVAAPDDGSDPIPENNESGVNSPVVSVADVAVSKSASVSQVAPGDSLQFFIHVDNPGPSDAAAVTLVDVLPPAFGDAQWSCEGEQGAVCPAAAGSGDVSLDGPLAAGGRWSLVIETEVRAEAALGLVTNTATATVAAPVTDPQADNNQSSTHVEITDDPDVDIVFSDRFEEQP